MFPRLSLLDIKYLRSAPIGLIRATALDAFGHLIESGLNTNATDYSLMFVHEGLRLWGRAKAALTQDSLSDSALRDLFNASTFGGMAIAHTGTSLPHALSYGLTYNLGIAHGRAVSHFMASYLREAGDAGRELLSYAGIADADEFEALYLALCGRENVPEALAQQIADAMLSNTAKLAACPYPVNKEIIYRICGL